MPTRDPKHAPVRIVGTKIPAGTLDPYVSVMRKKNAIPTQSKVKAEYRSGSSIIETITRRWPTSSAVAISLYLLR